MRFIYLLILLILTLIPFVSAAQTSDPGLVTLDRIYIDKDFDNEKFGPARWLEDGSGYTTLEKSITVQNALDIIRYNPKSGKREVMVSASLLIPKGKVNALDIEDYSWSPKNNMLLIFTNGKKVWRQNTRGDYWILNMKTQKLHQLGTQFPTSTLMFAKVSPDETKAGYVVKNNIYVEDLISGKVNQLTKDGSKTIINGTFDWVYEEEFDCRDGFRWSPDSKHIAYWQLDASGVGEFYLINYTDSLYSKIIPVQYPKAGTTNSACKVGVINASGGQTTWFKVEGDPRNNYIPRMEWANNSKEVMIQHMNRRQSKIQIMLGKIQDGSVKTVLTETDDAWLDEVNDLKWLNKGKEFTWVSERDGWRHAYKVSRNGEKIKLLTKGDYDVISIEKIDDKGGWLYFIASPNNPTQRYLYRIKLNGKGKAQRLSPKNMAGFHEYQISEDAKWAIHTYSFWGQPRIVDLVSLPSHKKIRDLAPNKKAIASFKALKRGKEEFFRIDIGDGVELDGVMMKPYNFDPAKKYPVLYFVYNEPAGQRVLDKYPRYYPWHIMLTQKGYIIISIDSRGTPAPRGREFRKCIHKKLGTLNTDDLAKAAIKINGWPFVDSNRIAIWGWSGGGSVTLNALFRYPKIFKTGLSVAPVPDQRYYDTIYQERYCGIPTVDSLVYKEGSPITYAENLEGNLLLVHGTGDDNVHYQGTEALINKLIEHNRHFSMMAYPNQNHSINLGVRVRQHVFGLLSKYLQENLEAGGK